MAETYKVSPLSPVRKMIAARMTEAVTTIPHFRLVADIKADVLLQLRKELKASNPAEAPSVNDLIIKACASALMDTPAVNVQWADGEIRQFGTADISVVTAIEGGLSTPIVRQAESKSVWEIAREVKQLTERAARNALRMEQIIGGTFSVSNLGMYGVDQFDAIINPPQCAILAVGCARPRCVPSGPGGAQVVAVLTLTLSIDHRVLDGAVAARFLSALRSQLESPAQLVN